MYYISLYTVQTYWTSMSLIPYIYKSIESKYQVTSVIECTVKFAFDSCNIVSLTEPLILALHVI